MKVKDIMTKEVIVVNKENTIKEVAHKLIENKITCMPVVDEANHVVGVISEKDLIYKEIDPSMPATVEYLGGIIFLGGTDEYQEELRKLTATKVEQMMSKEVIAVSQDENIHEVARMLVDKGINSVPVIEQDKLVGIVSSTDIVKTLIQ
ncbi:MAG: hypothetical protein PWP27_1943 [Clostridiales bacterium]|jgi:CBS domain-containing protein|nr:hypothetical protein [Clostridiales bacterium]MDK2934133.1 hypothetical protein [Clostridiales bacterium]